jgi:hypothetical protein
MEKKAVKASDLKTLDDLSGRMVAEHRKSLEDKMVLQEDMARQKAIVISDLMPTRVLGQILRELPKDTKIVRVTEDAIRNKKFIFVLSKEFPMLEEGEQVPEMKFSFNEKGEVSGEFKEAKGFLDALEDL